LVDSRHEDGGIPVFTLAVDRTEEGEGAEVPFVLGQVVWLDSPQAFDDRLVCKERNTTFPGIGTAKNVDHRLGAVFIRLIDDGEIGSSVGRASIPEGELPREVVERPMKAVADISDDVRDGGGWWVAQVRDDLISLRLGLVFGDGYIWLNADVVGNCEVEDGYLMIGPSELGENLIKVAGAHAE
jgi:hypothetical protein